MPKFIGNVIEGAVQIHDNCSPSKERIKLSFSQAILLPAKEIMCSLNTSDKGSKGSYAKRWYEWFALPETILKSPQSTQSMLEKINK